MVSTKKILRGLIGCCWCLASTLWAQNHAFVFGEAASEEEAVRVSAPILYDAERGFGFEPAATPRADGGALGVLREGHPFYFSTRVPEGNYRVRAVLRGGQRPGNVTVRAELRRLMIENQSLTPGEQRTVEFVVNTRRPEITGGPVVRLKPREKAEEAWAWDDKLTLEFAGENAALTELSIQPVDTISVVYLLGDSTVADQPREPYASWGQMLTRFFAPSVVVANHAESGESLDSSKSAQRLAKVTSLLRPGDWVLVQFGHNDQKGVTAEAFGATLREYVAAIREKGARPVIITSMHRRNFDEAGRVVDTHRDFPPTARAVAAELSVPLIDLHAMSAPLYEALGPERSGLAFKEGDRTHHNAYGAYQLAKCVAEGIRQSLPELAAHLSPDFSGYNPATPDDPDAFFLPASPGGIGAKPDGS